jgi:hypothetical protein
MQPKGIEFAICPCQNDGRSSEDIMKKHLLSIRELRGGEGRWIRCRMYEMAKIVTALIITGCSGASRVSSDAAEKLYDLQNTLTNHMVYL